MLDQIAGSAKAIAAVVVGFAVSYLSAKGFELDPIWVSTATGIVGGIIVWYVKNRQKEAPAP